MGEMWGMRRCCSRRFCIFVLSYVQFEMICLCATRDLRVFSFSFLQVSVDRVWCSVWSFLLSPLACFGRFGTPKTAVRELQGSKKGSKTRWTKNLGVDFRLDFFCQRQVRRFGLVFGGF